MQTTQYRSLPCVDVKHAIQVLVHEGSPSIAQVSEVPVEGVALVVVKVGYGIGRIGINQELGRRFRQDCLNFLKQE